MRPAAHSAPSRDRGSQGARAAAAAAASLLARRRCDRLADDSHAMRKAQGQRGGRACRAPRSSSRSPRLACSGCAGRRPNQERKRGCGSARASASSAGSARIAYANSNASLRRRAGQAQVSAHRARAPGLLLRAGLGSGQASRHAGDHAHHPGAIARMPEHQAGSVGGTAQGAAAALADR